MAYDFTPHTLKQNYAQYTAEDFEVWRILFNRQMQILPAIASQEYLDGLERIGFSAEKIPEYAQTNEILKEKTGWQIHVVPGLIDNKPFFELMQAKNFCASTWLRRRDQLDYLEEPDMFHDIFGHVPLLTNQAVCHYLEELARIALRFVQHEIAVEYIARLYWYTVEFGLIREKGVLKIYGAGILSSSGESDYSLHSDIPQRLAYDIKKIFDTPYIKDHFQKQYFVIDSYDALFNSIPQIESELEKRMAESMKYEVF